MNIARAVTAYVLFAIAIAWPIDLFLYIPGLNVSFMTILALVLAGLLVVDVSTGEKLRVPFEMIWPVVGIGAVLTLIAIRETPAGTLEPALALLVFIATTHFARGRVQIERWLLASSIGGGFVCAASVVGPQLGLLPTAFSFDHGATLTFANDLPGGLYILAICFAVTVYFTLNPTTQPVLRTCMTAGVLFLGTTLLGKLALIVFSGSFSAGTPLLQYETLDLVAIALALWLLVRVLAKVELQRRESATRFHVLLWAIALITLTAMVFGPFQVRVYHGFLLGLACGYVLPERESLPDISWPKGAAALVALTFVANLLYIFPANQADPRNYEVRSREDTRNADFNTLLQRLSYIEERAPAERRTHLWRARTYLTLGEPNGAAMAFAESLRTPTGRLLLAAPTEEERAEFVVQLRDHTSTLPEDEAVSAYERTMLAIGERDAALFSLQLLTGITLAHADNISSSVLAEAAAFVIGDPSLKKDLDSWSPDQLLTLLAQWGADIAPAPPEIPSEILPAVFVVQRRLENIDAFIALGASRHSFQVPLSDVALPAEQLTQPRTWLEWSVEGEGGVEELAVRARVVAGNASSEIGVFLLPEGGSPAFHWSLDEGRQIPFTPGIRILLPLTSGS